jgi:hypothetical protein
MFESKKVSNLEKTSRLSGNWKQAPNVKSMVAILDPNNTQKWSIKSDTTYILFRNNGDDNCKLLTENSDNIPYEP